MIILTVIFTRHLRFAHPTYIYGELSFEIDENGDPYWIAPVKKFNIGLFGGETVGKVVICNAVTGKTKTYDVGKCTTVGRPCIFRRPAGESVRLLRNIETWLL